jgi:hypothetical protein
MDWLSNRYGLRNSFFRKGMAGDRAIISPTKMEVAISNGSAIGLSTLFIAEVVGMYASEDCLAKRSRLTHRMQGSRGVRIATARDFLTGAALQRSGLAFC